MTLVIDDFTGAERDILVRAGVRREDATLEGTVLHRLTLDRTLSEETYQALARPDGFLSDRDLAALLLARNKLSVIRVVEDFHDVETGLLRRAGMAPWSNR